MIEGFARIMRADYAEPINLGTDDEVTMLDLAKRIRDLCGSSSEIVLKPLPADDPRQRRPDLSRARRIIRWDPATSLDAGLTKTIAYFRERIEKIPA
jgi:nucleoside-diphosphate-sugar epimerase